MRVFVDTSALYALIDASDRHHAEAGRLYRSLLGAAHLVTSNYVLVEADQLVRRRLGNEAGDRLRDDLLPPISVVWVDEPMHRTAVEAQRVTGAKVSLVDHVSFVLMRRSGTEVAFAFDADFEAHGFRRPQAEASPGHRLSEERGSYGSKPPLEVGAEPAEGALELVSVAEISARSGRPTNTIQSWRRRHADFPTPIATLAAGPVWHWSDVSRWVAKRESGRAAQAVSSG